MATFGNFDLSVVTVQSKVVGGEPSYSVRIHDLVRDISVDIPARGHSAGDGMISDIMYWAQKTPVAT